MQSQLTKILAIIQMYGGPVAMQLLASFAPAALPIAKLILDGVDKAGQFFEADEAAKGLTDAQLQALLDGDEKQLLKDLDADILRLEMKLADEKLAKAKFVGAASTVPKTTKSKKVKS